MRKDDVLVKVLEKVLVKVNRALDKEGKDNVDAELLEGIIDFQFALVKSSMTKHTDIQVPYFGSFRVIPKYRDEFGLVDMSIEKKPKRTIRRRNKRGDRMDELPSFDI
ncbi:MAG: hypothetical protein COA82_03605 [Alkaliphilus sp.]|nr:MAG: hypothetical protein COA82_03605 [Alkaliphilus sp.]